MFKLDAKFTHCFLEASYYNDRLREHWKPLIKKSIIKEDLYRPLIINLWFALLSTGRCNTLPGSKGIESIDFLVQDLDYSCAYKVITTFYMCVRALRG